MAYTYAGHYTEALLERTASGALRALPDTQVRVRLTDGTTSATLYTSRLKSLTAANPATTDAAGNLTLFADPGDYYGYPIVDGVEGDPFLIVVPIDPAEADDDPLAGYVTLATPQTITAHKGWGGAPDHDFVWSVFGGATVTAQSNIERTITAVDDAHFGELIQVLVDPASTPTGNDAYAALWSTMRTATDATDWDNQPVLYGGSFEIDHHGSGKMWEAIGLIGGAYGASLGEIDHLVGVEGRAGYVGNNLFVPVRQVDGVVGAAWALGSDTQQAHSFYASSLITGTVEDYYGIRLRAAGTFSGGTVTNRWGVYQEDVLAKNVLAGAMFVGEADTNGYSLSGVSAAGRLDTANLFGRLGVYGLGQAAVGDGDNGYFYAGLVGSGVGRWPDDEISGVEGSATYQGVAEHTGRMTGATGFVVGAGPISAAASLRARALQVAGALDDYYGLYLETAGTAGAGSIANRYGLYQEDPAASNFFAGPISIRGDDDRYLEVAADDYSGGYAAVWREDTRSYVVATTPTTGVEMRSDTTPQVRYTYFDTTDVAAPNANTVVTFARQSGGGKAQLCVRFPTGAVQVLATEP